MRGSPRPCPCRSAKGIRAASARGALDSTDDVPFALRILLCADVAAAGQIQLAAGVPLAFSFTRPNNRRCALANGKRSRSLFAIQIPAAALGMALLSFPRNAS